MTHYKVFEILITESNGKKSRAVFMEIRAITRAVKKDGGVIMENKLELVYKEVFKNSKISLSKSDFTENVVLYIKLYLAQSKDEEINGYFDNDMFIILLKVTKNSENNYTMEKINSSYLTKPTNEYMAYGRRQLPFRKTQGDEDKIITTFKKYVGNLHKALLEDLEQGNIHENHLELVKEKIK